MKVLFAVNNEKISEAIIKKYQAMYKEIISWKNVYYFNAIIKELQRDKSYDRIVIGEDLEPYTNNNYEVIDNFLFDKLDSISDEATNAEGGDIPIIIITSERRNKGNALLTKIFGIAIYNALMGTDRSYENVCKLINKPRTKKEAKIYYGIEADDVETYKPVNTESVPEEEMNNIIKHYKKLGKDEEKYVESFDEIATQYTDVQLKIIAAKLPLNVKAVLEEKSEKYKQVMIGSVKGQIQNEKKWQEQQFTMNSDKASKAGNRIGLIDKQLQRTKITKPVVIPSEVNLQKVEQVYKKESQPEDVMSKIDEVLSNKIPENETSNLSEPMLKENSEETEPKRGRGRPRKNTEPKENLQQGENLTVEPKRGRGRPKKVSEPIEVEEKQDINLGEDASSEQNKTSEPEELIDLFGLSTETNQEEEPAILPGLEESDIYEEKNTQNSQEQTISNNDNSISSNYNTEPSKEYGDMSQQAYDNRQNQMTPTTEIKNVDLSSLLVGDKKIVSLVGTSKNGTSFLVNNLAALLSQKGIKTAILDLTKNKNSYYIYNLNDDNLRNKAISCIDNLRYGIADGIQVNKNLAVYTTLPGDNPSFDDYGAILETLLNNYSLILLDCDFSTNINYFEQSQEIFLVQTFDILTIQPLTAFLNQLQHKGVLKEEKLRIILNKTLKLRKLTNQMIIGGISCYNDPEATYQNQLFNKDTIRYATIPFEEQTYAKYLERLVDCEINLNGYSKGFIEALTKLSDMVYPLIANNNNSKQKVNYNNYEKKSTGFNTNIDSTLDKMRKQY